MSFQLYEQTRALQGEETVSITPTGVINFSGLTTAKYLKGVDFVQVLFDPNTKRVGIRPAKQSDDFAFKLTRPVKSKRALFSGRGFLKNYNISVDGDKFKAATFKVKYENGMIIFNTQT